MKHQLRNHSGDKHFSLLGYDSRVSSLLMHTASNYPFGLVIDDLSYFNQDITNTSANRYLYNGKELQADAELDWYDYGARFYDPQIARFHTTDLFSEAYSFQSPYVYAANNPITYIDYLGMYPRGDYDDGYGYFDQGDRDDPIKLIDIEEFVIRGDAIDTESRKIREEYLIDRLLDEIRSGSDERNDRHDRYDRDDMYNSDDEVDAISGAGLPANSGVDATNRGGDGIDEIGIDINYGFGYGYKTSFGSAQVKIGNAKVWSLKYSNSKIQKTGFMQDSDMLMFSYQRSIPLINLGFGLTLHSESGIDLYGTFGPWNFGTENGLIVDGTYGFHLGIIGAEGYIRTSDTQSFIQSIPNARQQFYETTGFMWNIR